MNRRTRLLIGLSLLALGVGVAALAFLEQEGSVRYVEELLERPEEHTQGSYTLLGIPQPPLVPRTGAEGTVLVPNLGYDDEVVTVTAWSEGGVLYHSTHILSVASADGVSEFSYRNETRRAGSPDLAFPAVESAWSLPGTAFPVDAFDDGDGSTPRVWALYDGVLKNPLAPKPSQFKGHLLSTLPDGAPVPDGALLYQVQPGGITAGCSSNFLPPETEEKYEGAA